MQHLLEAHRQVATKLIRNVNPLAGYSARGVWVSHSQDGTGEQYQATLHHPQHWSLEEAIAGDADAPGTAPSFPDMKAARWVSIRTEPHGEAYPIKVAPPRANQWEVVGGVGNRLNGLVVTGLIDDQRYHGLTKTRAAANARVEAEKAKLARIEADVMARKASASDKVAIQEHVVPMHRLQAVDYMAAIHAGDQDEAARIINGHPLAGKSQFVVQYTNGHPGEGLMVYSHTSGVARALAHALKAEGHNASHVEVDGKGIVTIPNDRPSTAGKLHIIHHDGPVETVPDSKQHHSVHVLKSEGEAMQKAVGGAPLYPKLVEALKVYDTNAPDRHRRMKLSEEDDEERAAAHREEQQALAAAHQAWSEDEHCPNSLERCQLCGIERLRQIAGHTHGSDHAAL